jgi:hypothetical protein
MSLRREFELTDAYVRNRLLPALKMCGLTTDDIVAQNTVQEIVYLLKQTGCELGYRFKWELFGPYSRELSEEICELNREVVDAAPTAPHSEGTERLNELLRPPDELELRVPDWLRLVVAVDFVERRTPGATTNGGTPPYLSINYTGDAIAVAREKTALALGN